MDAVTLTGALLESDDVSPDDVRRLVKDVHNYVPDLLSKFEFHSVNVTHPYYEKNLGNALIRVRSYHPANWIIDIFRRLGDAEYEGQMGVPVNASPVQLKQWIPGLLLVLDKTPPEMLDDVVDVWTNEKNPAWAAERDAMAAEAEDEDDVFESTRSDGDTALAELQPIFAQHGYQLELVGSLSKGDVGKDIDFLIKPGTPGTTIEEQMRVFYDEIAPVLEEMRWSVYNSPSDRLDGSWFVTAVTPTDHVVDIFMTGPFGYNESEEDLSIEDALDEAQVQTERDRPVSEAAIAHRLEVISGKYCPEPVAEAEEEEDVDAGYEQKVVEMIGEAKTLAPVRFATVMPGFPTNAWFKPTQPFPTPDEYTYQPTDNISLMKLMRWGYQIPPAEYQKFIAAGGQAGGEKRVVQTEAAEPDGVDAPAGGLLSYFKARSLVDVIAKIKTIPYYIDGGLTDEGTERAYFTNAKEGLDYCWWVCLDVLDRESVRMAWLLAYPSTCSGGTADRDFPPDEAIPQIKVDFDKWLADFKRSFPELLVHVEWITSHLLPESEEPELDPKEFISGMEAPEKVLKDLGFVGVGPWSWIDARKQHVVDVRQIPNGWRITSFLVGLGREKSATKEFASYALRAGLEWAYPPFAKWWRPSIPEAEEPEIDPKAHLARVVDAAKILRANGFVPEGTLNDFWMNVKKRPGDDTILVRRVGAEWEVTLHKYGLELDPKRRKRFSIQSLDQGLKWVKQLSTNESEEPDINAQDYVDQVDMTDTVLCRLGFVKDWPADGDKDVLGFWSKFEGSSVYFIRKTATALAVQLSFPSGHGAYKTYKKEFPKNDLRAALKWGDRVWETFGLNIELGEAKEPTDAQKEAGNYKMRHLVTCGFDISIETEKDGIRSGTSPGGDKWEVKMPCAYGYLKGTEGKDGDHVDVYVKEPVDEGAPVFVLDQKDADTGKFDEHKCFLFFKDEDSVRAVYDKAFDDGKAKDRIGAITKFTLDEFKAWLDEGDTTKKCDGQGIAVAESAKPELTRCGQCGATLHAPNSVGKGWALRLGNMVAHDNSQGHFDYVGKFIEDTPVGDLPPGSQLEPLPDAFSCMECGEPVGAVEEPPLAEAVDPDDVNPREYLAQVVPPPLCLNCGSNFFEKLSVRNEFIHKDESGTYNQYGHYDHKWNFVPDEEFRANPADFMQVSDHEFCGYCGQPTGIMGVEEAKLEEAEDDFNDVADPKHFTKQVFSLDAFLREHGFQKEEGDSRYTKYLKQFPLPQKYKIANNLHTDSIVVEILIDDVGSHANGVRLCCGGDDSGFGVSRGSGDPAFGRLCLREYSFAKSKKRKLWLGLDRRGQKWTDLDASTRRFVHALDSTMAQIEWPSSTSFLSIQSAIAPKFSALVDRVNLAESEEDIDAPEAYTKDYERILVPFTTEEDCQILSDRWGEVNDVENEKEVEIVNRLRDFMGGNEDSFIAIRNGEPGILREWELSTPGVDDADDVKVCWDGKEMTYDEAKKVALTRATRLKLKHPEYFWYVTQGNHTFNNRIAIRAFIPNPTEEVNQNMHVA